MVAISHLPLKWHGVQIGEIAIDDNGDMAFILHPSSRTLGREITHFAERGLIEGLDMRPIAIPAVPAIPQRRNT